MEPCDVIEDDVVSDFFSGLRLDKKLTCNETDQLLPDTPLLSAHLEHVCKEWKFFSVKKCGIDDCSSCLAAQLPPDVFSILHHLPDPEPSEINKGHYKTFNQCFNVNKENT